MNVQIGNQGEHTGSVEKLACAERSMMNSISTTSLHACNELRNVLKAPARRLSNVNDVLDQLRVALYEHIRADSSRLAQLPGLHTWPSKLLLRVTGYLSLEDCEQLAMTCRGIRSTLYACPALWNWVHVTSSNSNCKVWNRAHRTLNRGAPLDRHLRLRVSSVCDPAAWAVLSDLLPSLATLYLYINIWNFSAYCRETDQLPQVAQVWRLLSQVGGSPALRTLCIGGIAHRTARAVTGYSYVADDILHPTPGALTTLTLRNMALLDNRTYLAFRNVTFFNYSYWHGPILDVESWTATVLNSMPKLEDFVVSDCRFAEMQPGDQNDTKVSSPLPLLPHNIRRFRGVRLSGGGDELASLFAGVPDLYLEDQRATDSKVFDAWPTTDLTMLVNERLKLHSEAGSMWRTIELPLASDLSQSQSPWNFGSRYNVVVPLSPSHADRVVALSIAEMYWSAAVYTLPALPRLTDLTILMQGCWGYRNAGAASGGLFNAQCVGPNAFHLSALQRLRIWASDQKPWLKQSDQLRCSEAAGPMGWKDSQTSKSERLGWCCCDNGCTIALSDVEEFVRSILSEGSRLPWLSLSGMAAVVDVDAVTALCSLYRCVDTVDFQQQPPEAELRMALGEHERDSPQYPDIASWFRGRGLPRTRLRL
ncbi:hypothetical protein BKA62DRAFT_112854 [Auriculariales sp. MPI-PUGE-AT-0066]|nr:hypothetical protein BKA62DRAFT_112854 [Auriculariales sp. MPI-PUGE-AT-0066]